MRLAINEKELQELAEEIQTALEQKCNHCLNESKSKKHVQHGTRINTVADGKMDIKGGLQWKMARELNQYVRSVEELLNTKKGLEMCKW